jgi:hypothetical protein
MHDVVFVFANLSLTCEKQSFYSEIKMKPSMLQYEPTTTGSLILPKETDEDCPFSPLLYTHKLRAAEMYVFVFVIYRIF